MHRLLLLLHLLLQLRKAFLLPPYGRGHGLLNIVSIVAVLKAAALPGVHRTEAHHDLVTVFEPHLLLPAPTPTTVTMLQQLGPTDGCL